MQHPLVMSQVRIVISQVSSVSSISCVSGVLGIGRSIPAKIPPGGLAGWVFLVADPSLAPFVLPYFLKY